MGRVEPYNIVSGHVTNRRDHVPFRVTARKVAKRVAIIGTLVFFALLALGFAVQAAQGDWTGQQQRQERQLPPCEYEGASGCYWDADTMGNGQGSDYVAP